MGRLLALGDIHGARLALEQVLDRANYDPSSDRIVFLGDVADGWPETKEAVDVLLSIPDGIYIQGNHDVWCREWMQKGTRPQPIWWDQGGRETIHSYARAAETSVWDTELWKKVPRGHVDYFEGLLPYYVDEERSFLFVHGGFRFNTPLQQQDPEDLCWDRDLWALANHMAPEERISSEGPPGPFRRIFIGHTDTNTHKPVREAEVWNLDTGAGWQGVLSLMDVDTEESWQSDKVSDLYPSSFGRR